MTAGRGAVDILLMLDMTDALRPSELFAFRWKSFDDLNTLSITETIYRRKIRPFGKTPGSMTKVHLPDGLAAELRQWKLPRPIPGRADVPERGRRVPGPGQLPVQSFEAPSGGVGTS